MLRKLDGPRSQRELARGLDVDASAVSVIVGQLLQRDLVVCKVSERDRRVRLVARTALAPGFSTNRCRRSSWTRS
ncbi:MarR family transcriptional regulator [Nocardia sp. CA-135953]|uniref:MarR family transcriptional regulator n=1 Tax=Nocardia sp. CA-135953 TaxID=3239978 RepID=UPI003D98A71B